MKLKYTIDALIRQNYITAHPYCRLRLWLDGQRSNDKIVIYQMGKVGSTAIWKSLESLKLDSPIYHIHILETEKINKAIAKNRLNYPKLGFMYPHILHSEYLRGQLNSDIQQKWNVITLVRDPTAQILSQFFEKLQAELLLGLDYRTRCQEAGEPLILQEIISRFYQECVDNPTQQHPFEWFNYELKKNLNFDIFSTAKLSNKGYAIYNTEMVRVLLLKLESLQTSYPTAFQEFLDIENFKLVKSNVGHKKAYGSLYKSFLREVNLPVRYLDAIYQTELVKQFYSDLEIQTFYQRWQTL